MTGAFSHEYIISFIAASSLVLNELSDIAAVSHAPKHTQIKIQTSTIHGLSFSLCVTRRVKGGGHRRVKLQFTSKKKKLYYTVCNSNPNISSLLFVCLNDFYLMYVIFFLV